MVVMTLSAAGLDVIEAINGADGYAKATGQTVHAVITDLNMPVMNGIEFIRKYRQHPSSKGVPIAWPSTTSTVTCWPAKGQWPGLHGATTRGGSRSLGRTTVVSEPFSLAGGSAPCARPATNRLAASADTARMSAGATYDR
jgi:CheY-like chemotaxis protein